MSNFLDDLNLDEVEKDYPGPVDTGAVDLYEEFEADSGPDGEQVLARLGEISDLAKKQQDLEAEVAELTAKLKVANAKLSIVSEVDIPTLFNEIGISEISLDDGSSVSVFEKLVASIPKKNKKKCAAYLKKTGNESLLFTDIIVKFDAGDTEKAQEAFKLLEEKYENVTAVSDMNTASVKVVLQKQLEAGENPPLALFGATVKKGTKINNG